MSSYIGRFAPSPTGPLHLGSLVAAVGSYLDAKARNGKWLLRIEDLDPPREMEGAAELIPQQLEAHGLYWDEPITYQSQRLTIYEEYLEQLIKNKLAFACDCSRQRIKQIGGSYDGLCRNRELGFDHNRATRVRWDDEIQWEDLFLKKQAFAPELLGGDFVIKRRDGLFSYQLAVAIDDSLQNISHVIRGEDLLDSTARQKHLQKLLNIQSPEYGHLPTLKDKSGQKLSKQNYAKPLDSGQAAKNLILALRVLGQEVELDLVSESPGKILKRATELWERKRVPTSAAFIEDLEDYVGSCRELRTLTQCKI